jgi:hypothetical protein
VGRAVDGVRWARRHGRRLRVCDGPSLAFALVRRTASLTNTFNPTIHPPATPSTSSSSVGARDLICAWTFLRVEARDVLGDVLGEAVPVLVREDGEMHGDGFEVLVGLSAAHSGV